MAKRSTTANTFVYILLGLLAVSLVGFGVPLASSVGNASVATIGQTEVTAQDYDRTLREQITALRQRGSQVGPADIQGLSQAVLEALLDQAALDDEASDLGLSVSDDMVRDEIAALPQFRSSAGFDRESYDFFIDRLYRGDASEFEETVRAERTRELLATAFGAGVTAPDAAATLLLERSQERRTVRWFAVPPDGAPLADPGDAALRALLDADSDAFAEPLFRTVTVAAITPEELASDVEISDATVEATFEAQRSRLGQPAQRNLDRIVFPDQAAAEAARARLDEGTSFEAIAAERGLAPADIALGDVTADRLAPAARAVVFGADGLGIYGPVQSSLGPALFRINGIEHGLDATLEVFGPRIRQELAEAQALAQLPDIGEAVTDLSAGGASVEAIADGTGLTLRTLEITRGATEGLGADPAIQEAVFAAEIGATSDPIQLRSGGLAVLRVDAETPARIPDLADIRDQVRADFDARRVMAFAQAEALGLAARANEAERFETVAAGAEIRSAEVTRTDSTAAPASVVAMAFAIEEGASAAVETADGSVVLQVTAVAPFDPEGEDAELVAQVGAQLAASIRRDLVVYGARALRAERTVGFNPPVIEAVLANIR